MGIVEFLEARIAEDEAVARDAAKHHGQDGWHVNAVPHEGLIVWDSTDVPGHSTPTTVHLARHDPARILREVAAKRAILAQAREAEEYYAHMRGNGLPAAKAGGHVDALTVTLTHLASTYADHPDYDESWAL
ncbi:hypothetical protein ABH922_003013 [Rhodococcus sp. 27YEA15]|uniref:DUF6221 family protein n=1 Tax=Rhodococcus sp. 27YEA15 TaxID=3156259 RepID=UPI003C7BD812